VSRRASLPGADELFRRTASDRGAPPRRQEDAPTEDAKSTSLQVAQHPPETSTELEAERRGPKHDEKVTFYCTSDDLLALEKARLRLRSEHGVAADRGRIVRAALGYVLEDFEARGDDSLLLRRLTD
jgi:hypothetical protein